MATDSGDSGLIDAFDRMSKAFYKATPDRPWTVVRIDEDVTYADTGIPLETFNGAAFATFSESGADARIDDVLGFFRARRTDMSWWVGPASTPTDLVDRLVAHGLVLEGSVPAMTASIVDWTPPPAPDGIEIEPVVDAAAFHVAMEVMFDGFEMPREMLLAFEERYRDHCVGPSASGRFFTARLDGRPVATGLGLPSDGLVGIFNVATLPDARRRGAGGAVTAAAMAYGRACGARDAVLESSEIGRSVYERLGFRQVGEVRILVGRFGGSA
ncbi:MAG TPA: GNAT family N-acetyltransferase [Candidatus Limnocylindrales bacterium]|jgi:GNAT superfamily N-acetyltransferase|nr:GNAT family N-acetyltransferase [Candidatus Limnocylindrales bacterium]